MSILVVLFAYILSMAGLGVLLSGFLKTQQQVPAVATGIASVGTMLGGVFFPSQGNRIMEFVGKISPPAWAAKALNSIMTGQATLNTMIEPVAWMACIGVIFLVIGVLRTKFE